MKKRFTEGGLRPLSTERNGTRSWLAIFNGLGFAVAILAAALAEAEEPERVAQAGDPEPRAVASDSAAEPDPAASDPAAEPDPAASETAAEQQPRARRGIEEIIVLGAESEAASDFGAGDSVTGFGAEDLAALGAQDIADIAAFTPNLEIVTYGSTSPTFFIRGVGLNDFNSNSTGAVAIYRDDVPFNAPPIQLSSLFDVEAVNVLRGPQGTGQARNASAGAIRIYSRKPTGEFGGFLRSELGDFNFRDFEGAVEAPIIEDILAGRFAFRLTERDGTMTNRCAKAPAFGARTPVANFGGLDGRRAQGKTITDPPWSICGEPVVNFDDDEGNPNGVSDIPVGLPSKLNDLDNWAARGTLLFQPTLDMTWLLNAHGSRRDEWSRVGQSIGTGGPKGFYCDPSVTKIDPETGETIPATENCNLTSIDPDSSRVEGLLGASQGTGALGYQAPEIRERLVGLAPCNESEPFFPGGTCDLTEEGRASDNKAKIRLANELAQGLDREPWAGDFNMCGTQTDENGDFVDRDTLAGGFFRYVRPFKVPGEQDSTLYLQGSKCKKDKGRTTNDTWGTYLKGDIVLPFGMQLTTVSSFDTFDRLLDVDLDFSPETLFQIRTDDEGWQVTQSLGLKGQLGDEGWLRWDIGGWFLREKLDVKVTNDLGIISAFGVGEREYTQDLWSAAGYLSLAFDFWDDFTLDGGFRYNWEQKKLDYALESDGNPVDPDTNEQIPIVEKLNDIWKDPTGTVRLTYRFREDTHVFWKYTRGWKPGTYNATSSPEQGVSVARPEQIDAFETGLRGSWFDGRFGLDFSFFYYAYEDYQIFTAQQFAGGQPEFVIINADEAEVYGAELDAMVRPWTGAFANVRFGWLESQFLDFVQIQQEIIIEFGSEVTVNRELQNTGNRLLNSPQFKVSLTAEQTLPLGRWGAITARYDGVWTDVTYYDATEGLGIPNQDDIQFMPDDTIAQPSYWLHNLRISFRPASGGWEFAGWVRNLTDEAYKTFAFDASTFNETSIYFVGDPRTYGGTLIINF